jgi:hypothetical protein
MDETSKLLLTVAIPTVTVLIGILVNNRQLDSLRNEMNARFEAMNQVILRIEGELRSDLRRIEGELRSDLDRVEGVLTVKIDALAVRVKALEDAIHSPLVKK